ncbi:MAG: hypothetical protein AAF399_06215 [Bacteroidota bacterium]
MKQASFLLMLSLLPAWASAQIFGPSTDSTTRVWNVRFLIDPGLTTFQAQARDSYQGEQFVQFENGQSLDEPYWQWADWDTVDRNILDFYKLGHFRAGVLVNLYRNWYIGLNYRFYLVQGFRSISPNQNDFQYVYWPFFSLSGSLTYDYPIPIFPRLRLQPNIAVGTYQANRLFEGAGREYSAEGRMALAFQPFKNRPHQLRLWMSHQWMGYRESDPSLIYDGRQRDVATDWQIFSAGIGAVYHIEIKEDPELDEGRSYKDRKADRLRKKQQKLEKKQAKLKKKQEKG